MVYAGIASDLLKLVPKLMQPIVEQWTINPEQLFHIAPVLDEDAEMVHFFRQNRGLPHGYQNEQLRLRNEDRLSDKLHLNMAIQSLDHLVSCYGFPSDYSTDDSSSNDVASYLGDTRERLIEVLSSPPPSRLDRHLTFNDSAKSLVVKSLCATGLMLERLQACSLG